MGLYPCSLDGRRFRGPAQTAYPTVLCGSTRLSAHLRLCPSCWDDLTERLTAHALELALDPSDDREIPLCVACGQPGDQDCDTVFVTCYARGADRADFLGKAHRGCVDTLERDWRLSSAA